MLTHKGRTDKVFTHFSDLSAFVLEVSSVGLDWCSFQTITNESLTIYRQKFHFVFGNFLRNRWFIAISIGVSFLTVMAVIFDRPITVSAPATGKELSLRDIRSFSPELLWDLAPSITISWPTDANVSVRIQFDNEGSAYGK